MSFSENSALCSGSALATSMRITPSVGS
ncbi:hypothetical protein [Roseovarius sp. 2305UL8-3]